MKAQPPPFQIKRPCPKRWDDMSGDAQRRYCDHCQLHVHNLSAMSGHERDRFVANASGHVCVAYDLRPDGTMVTPSPWRRATEPLRRLQFAGLALLAGLVPFLFTACATRKPSPLLGRMCPPTKADSFKESSNYIGGITATPRKPPFRFCR